MLSLTHCPSATAHSAVASPSRASARRASSSSRPTIRAAMADAGWAATGEAEGDALGMVEGDAVGVAEGDAVGMAEGESEAWCEPALAHPVTRIAANATTDSFKWRGSMKT